MFIVYDIEDHSNVEGILVHLTWIRVMVYTVALNVGISIFTHQTETLAEDCVFLP
jgi:hypothetical protein